MAATAAACEAVIGLEVHAQLRTRTKIFCRCPTTFGSPPNSATCPVCLGHPGALPVPNARAVELGVRAALALGCRVHERSVFARKNYFYPDLPKGYQISQYEQPLASGGAVAIESPDGVREVRLLRLHLEEDAGKSIHDGMPDSDRASYVDLNRAGTPLAEIVTRPDLRTPGEAYRFLERLRSILLYTDVCDGNMEQGSLRCDANVSIRPSGETELGTRTELKNLNSFRNVERALEHEIQRQVEIVSAGGEVVQQTVLWDAGAGRTIPMRGKEEAHDYRYFPEPDLPPLILDPAWIEGLRADLPELPADRRRRFVEVYALPEPQAHILTLEPELADYFEDVTRRSGNPRSAAGFVINDLLRLRRSADRGRGVPLAAERLAALIRMVDSGTISMQVARGLFDELYAGERTPEELVRERGLTQVSDEDELRGLCRRVLAENPREVELYRGGKRGVLGHFVGLVMRASGRRANPKKVNQLLRELIG